MTSRKCDSLRLPRRYTIAFLTAVTCCASQAQTPGAERGIEAASLGADLSGELSASSPVNLNDGTRYSAHRFCDADPDDATLYRFEGTFSAQLSLLNDNQRLVGRSSRDTEDDAGLILVSPEGDDCTTLVVSGADSSAFGPYELKAVAAESGDLTPGRNVRGQVTPGGSLVYPLSIDSPVRLDLNLIDSSRSLGLMVRGENFSDSALACGDAELRLTSYLTAGDYEITLPVGRRPETSLQAAECGAVAAGAGNAFHLITSAVAMPAGMRNGGPLSDGDAIQGVLQSGYVNEYRIQLDEMSRVTVNLASAEFDTILEMSGPDTELSNDDTDSGTNSELSTVLLAGTYRVMAKGFGDSEGGNYDIRARIESFTDELRNSGVIEPNTSLEGLFNEGSNNYSLTLEEQSEVRISVESDAFDAMLDVAGNGVSLNDDDSGGNQNPLVTGLLEAGTYNIAVGAFGAGGGVFTLSVERSEASGRMQDSGDLAPGDAVYGNLVNGKPLNYRLVVSEGRVLSIRTQSSSVDTILTLTGSGLDLRNDDGDDGTNSHLEQFLPPGEYTLQVRDFSDSSSGMVRLEISQ